MAAVQKIMVCAMKSVFVFKAEKKKQESEWCQCVCLWLNLAFYWQCNVSYVYFYVEVIFLQGFWHILFIIWSLNDIYQRQP